MPTSKFKEAHPASARVHYVKSLEGQIDKIEQNRFFLAEVKGSKLQVVFYCFLILFTRMKGLLKMSIMLPKE